MTPGSGDNWDVFKMLPFLFTFSRIPNDTSYPPSKGWDEIPTPNRKSFLSDDQRCKFNTSPLELSQLYPTAPPAMSLRDKWGGYVTTGLVAFTSGITLYLIISDTARRSEIRRRKNILSTLDEETAITALERAQHRFSVLRIGGRFVNPFDEYSSLICAFLGLFL